MSHGYHDGVHGDVHHDHVQDLQAYTQGGDVDDVETAGAHGEGLEESVEHTVVGGYAGCRGIADVEQLEGGPVDAVEDYYHEEEPPGWLGGEEVGVHASWVLEDEAESGFPFAVDFWGGVDEAEELEEGPEDESEEEGVSVW